VAVALVRVGLRRGEPASRTGAYAGAGLLAGLVFVGVTRQVLPGALLPLAPLGAILATWELGRELDRPAERAFGPLLLSGALGATALGLLLATATGLDPGLRRFAGLAALAHGCAAGIGLGGALARRPRWTWGAAAGASAIAAAMAVGLLPRLAEERTAGYLVEAVPELRSRPVAVLERDVPSLTFYLDHPLPVVSAPAATHPIVGESGGLLVATEGDLARIPPAARAGLREIGRRGTWVVLERSGERRIHPNRHPDVRENPGSGPTHNGRLTGAGPER
jgi:hypothetical protein